MSNDGLHERGHALEEQFFHSKDQQLLAQLKSQLQADEDRRQLAAATGIEDITTLKNLLDTGVRAETLAAVGLIPLVAVAWADGRMEEREVDAILKAAAESGITEDHACYNVLANWLKNRPGNELLDAWKAYVSVLRTSLDVPAFHQIHQSVMGRARDVAESAGGFLGVIATVDSREKAVLQELDHAFSG